MNKEKEKELLALGEEIETRRDKIIKEWLKTYKMPSRGRLAPEEQKALDEEAKRRYGEILAKYKDK